jgi:hypothetical protein
MGEGLFSKWFGKNTGPDGINEAMRDVKQITKEQAEKSKPESEKEVQNVLNINAEKLIANQAVKPENETKEALEDVRNIIAETDITDDIEKAA